MPVPAQPKKAKEMKRILLSIAAVAILAGCQSVEHTMQYAKTEKAYTSGFIIADKPSESRMLVQLRSGGAFKSGFGGRVSQEQFEIAANTHLAARNCRIHSIAVVTKPISYEAKYTCP